MEPAVDAAMSFVLECWTDLESCRQLAQLYAGPIPWSAIRDWCAWHECDRELAKIVKTAIHYLDARRAERISSELALKSKGRT